MLQKSYSNSDKLLSSQAPKTFHQFEIEGMMESKQLTAGDRPSGVTNTLELRDHLMRAIGACHRNAGAWLCLVVDFALAIQGVVCCRVVES